MVHAHRINEVMVTADQTVSLVQIKILLQKFLQKKVSIEIKVKDLNGHLEEKANLILDGTRKRRINCMKSIQIL